MERYAGVGNEYRQLYLRRQHQFQLFVVQVRLGAQCVEYWRRVQTMAPFVAYVDVNETNHCMEKRALLEHIMNNAMPWVSNKLSNLPHGLDWDTAVIGFKQSEYQQVSIH